MKICPLFLLALPLVATTTVGCKSAYYGFMEGFGTHKRDIMVDRVQDAREEQAEAQEQFKTTLEAFQELTGFQGGDLEDLYKRLNKEYERSADKAAAVTKRINSVETVSQDMFNEWQGEIGEMQNQELAQKSRDLLDDTKGRYEELIGKMRAAESKMGPVLSAFSDHVVFLKHNLNAQAIQSLKDTVLEIEGDVSTLIAQMQASIDEADAFIASMG